MKDNTAIPADPADTELAPELRSKINSEIFFMIDHATQRGKPLPMYIDLQTDTDKELISN